MTWITDEDEADFSDSTINEADLELRPCGWHPKTPQPPPPPAVTDLNDAGRKMLRAAVKSARSFREWQRGASRGQFTFADDKSAANASLQNLDSAREVVQYCIGRIKDGTHPIFDDLKWNIDPFLKNIDIMTTGNPRGISLPAIIRVQTLAELRAYRTEAWTEISEDAAEFRSWLWRHMITESSYICRSQALLLVLLCAPRAKLVSLAEPAFDSDHSDWYDQIKRECLETYAEKKGQDLARVRETFKEVTALLHAQDVDVDMDVVEE